MISDAIEMLYNGLEVPNIAILLNLDPRTLTKQLTENLNKKHLRDITIGHRAKLIQFFQNTGYTFRQMAELTGLTLSTLHSYSGKDAFGYPSFAIQVNKEIEDFKKSTVPIGIYKATVLTNLFLIISAKDFSTIISRNAFNEEDIKVVACGLTLDGYRKFLEVLNNND